MLRLRVRRPARVRRRELHVLGRPGQEEGEETEGTAQTLRDRVSGEDVDSPGHITGLLRRNIWLVTIMLLTCSSSYMSGRAVLETPVGDVTSTLQPCYRFTKITLQTHYWEIFGALP